MVPGCNCGTGEAKTGGFPKVQDEPALHSDTLSQGEKGVGERENVSPGR